MPIFKEIKNGEFYLYMDGQLIYKKWLNTGQSKVFDVLAYDKYTSTSIRELKYEMHRKVIEVLANLKMRTTEEGGRQTGFISGYRPRHVFEDYVDRPQVTFIGEIAFEGQNTIEPGEEKNVFARFLFEQKIEPYLNVGQKWLIYEAGKIIGEAEILAL